MTKKPFYCEGCGKKIEASEYVEYSGKCQDCKALEILILKPKAKSSSKTE